MTFGKWPEEIHGDLDQQKRIQSAKSPSVTPISVDKETQTGFFGGSAKKPYQVSLEECTCADYIRRKLPCKHMYRLAMELGLVTTEYGVSSNPGLHISLSEAVGEIENFSDDAQMFLMSLLGMVTSNNANDPAWIETDNEHTQIVGSSIYFKEFHPIGADCIFAVPFFELTRVTPEVIVPELKKKELEAVLDKAGVHPERKLLKADLAVWCLKNVPDLTEYLPERYYVTCAPRFKKAIHKCIKYLRRKYEWDSFYTEDNNGMKEVVYPYGAKFEDVEMHFGFNGKGISGYYAKGNPDVCYFPDDEITRLLTMYGHNRCLNGFKATIE